MFLDIYKSNKNDKCLTSILGTYAVADPAGVSVIHWLLHLFTIPQLTLSNPKVLDIVGKTFRDYQYVVLWKALLEL